MNAPGLAFAKYQGTGNDFLVVDGLAGEPDHNWPAVAPALCDRQFGVGGDGLLIVTRGSAAPFRMQVVNADGSIPEMCGNGLRCVARFLYDRGEVGLGPFAVETGAGVLHPEVLPDLQVRIDMGPPTLARALIPMAGPAADRVVAEPLALGDLSFDVTAVSMGNPHAVIFVPDLAAVLLADWGPRLERHASFPARANVEFVQVIDAAHARMIVWERGAGPTLACGTGACATLVAGVLTGRLAREAEIMVPGGPLAISWDARDHVWLQGPAVHVYDGRVDLAALLPRRS